MAAWAASSANPKPALPTPGKELKVDAAVVVNVASLVPVAEYRDKPNRLSVMGWSPAFWPSFPLKRTTRFEKLLVAVKPNSEAMKTLV